MGMGPDSCTRILYVTRANIMNCIIISIKRTNAQLKLNTHNFLLVPKFNDYKFLNYMMSAPSIKNHVFDVFCQRSDE